MFRAIDHHFEVACDDDTLGELIDETFAHCIVDSPDVDNAEHIEVSVRGAEVRIASDEGVVTVPQNRSLQSVVSMINLRGAQRRGETVPVLHGGAVSFGGEAILTLGRSGAGKSTLVSALAASGGEYLADELLAVRSATCVSGYPKAITLKPGSWAALPFERPDRTKRAQRFIDTVDYVAPEDAGALTVLDEAWPASIVFPTWDASIRTAEVEPLQPSDALLSLCEAAYLPLSPAAFFLLAELAGRCPAAAVRYATTDDALLEARREARTVEDVEVVTHGPSAQPSCISVADFGQEAVVHYPDGRVASIAGFDAAMWSAADQDSAHPLHFVSAE